MKINPLSTEVYVLTIQTLTSDYHALEDEKIKVWSLFSMYEVLKENKNLNRTFKVIFMTALGTRLLNAFLAFSRRSSFEIQSGPSNYARKVKMGVMIRRIYFFHYLHRELIQEGCLFEILYLHPRLHFVLQGGIQILIGIDYP